MKETVDKIETPEFLGAAVRAAGEQVNEQMVVVEVRKHCFSCHSACSRDAAARPGDSRWDSTIFSAPFSCVVALLGEEGRVGRRA